MVARFRIESPLPAAAAKADSHPVTDSHANANSLRHNDPLNPNEPD